MRNIGMMAIMTLLTVSGAGAQEVEKPVSEPIVQTAPAENDGGRLICKTAKETGSRVKRNKVCKTKQEWDDMRLNTNKQLDDYAKQAPPNPLPSS